MTTVAPSVGRLDEAESTTSRTIRPRRPWPGTRATVGGLLMAVASLGLFLAFRTANEPPTTLYVVARHDISPGTVITTDHVGAQRIDLPSQVSAAAFSAADDGLVLGAIALEAIGAGELVQQSDIRSGSADSALSEFEMSFRVDADRAVDGSLRAGERVDVIATIGTGPTATTATIERSVLITDVSRAGDSSLAADRQVITVALDQHEQALAIAAALDTGTVTLIRARGDQ